jgi:hypothetical protein
VTLTYEGYNGVLGEMPLGELVLGGYGVVIDTETAGECLTLSEPSKPVTGQHR